MFVFIMPQRNALSMAAIALLLGALLASFPLGVKSIAVCYGMLGDDLPTPTAVVKLFIQNGFESMRLYNPNMDALNVLRGTGINLMLGVANEDLGQFASDPIAASGWVHIHILSLPDVSFRYIAVGNEISGADTAHILPAMKNIYNALSLAGLNDQIKVSTAVDFGIIGTSYPPSAGAFSNDSISFMGPIVQFLSSTGAPLLANVYPYFSYVENVDAVDLDYAMFTSPDTVIIDGQYKYQNLFDAMVDVMYSAVEKAGGSDVPIVVSETGWPSDGGLNASVENAQIYNQNLIEHVKNGTPMKPGAIETYLFSMFNENQKPPGVEQHWGLFYPDESPVYSISYDED